MDMALPAVLLMEGGEWTGPAKRMAKALGDALFDQSLSRPISQIVIIFGRNQMLASALQVIEWKVPVKIRRFETQMEKWIGACDIFSHAKFFWSLRHFQSWKFFS
ncbi:hypothetical protein AMTR_s00051p00041120 [Amborella trichopoda]|uniref:Uncharacterized protein n=1 Tax=Amborella trichopoda TaxID=13333 RepID=U5CTM5_AMBTC|nr:hypothetical protein AMTR_s00051p00041120 [Amborella trichopoda]